MKFFNSLPRVVRDLIIFNSFIFMVRFILNYGFKVEFNVRATTLMAANTSLLIIHVLNHRISAIREEEFAEKNKEENNIEKKQ